MHLLVFQHNFIMDHTHIMDTTYTGSIMKFTYSFKHRKNVTILTDLPNSTFHLSIDYTNTLAQHSCFLATTKSFRHAYKKNPVISLVLEGYWPELVVNMSFVMLAVVHCLISTQLCTEFNIRQCIFLTVLQLLHVL